MSTLRLIQAGSQLVNALLFDRIYVQWSLLLTMYHVYPLLIWQSDLFLFSKVRTKLSLRKDFNMFSNRSNRNKLSPHISKSLKSLKNVQFKQNKMQAKYNMEGQTKYGKLQNHIAQT